MKQLALAMALGYLLGCFPSAYVIGRLVKGIDIRQHGSGNVGASNVFRIVGKPWGLLVLALDILKGLLAVTIVAPFFYRMNAWMTPILYDLLVGMATIAGHNWTLFLGFRGGKGVATSLGVGLGLLPKAAFAALGIWILFLIPFRFISVSSLAAALSFPLWIFLFYRKVPGLGWTLALSTLLAILIVYTHRSNIQRIREGKEHKVWEK